MRAANHRFVPIFLAAGAVFWIAGCAFYQLREHATSELAGQSDKTIILHFKDIQINLIHVQLTKVDFTGNVETAFRTADGPDNDIHSREQALEAHVYLDSLRYGNIMPGMALRIPLGDVNTLKLYDVNTQRMVMVYGGIGVAAALTIIFLATKQSCPFIYACDGSAYGFCGEIFSGAVYPRLERHDYLPLPSLQPVNGSYLLRITNEVKEVQHVNFMELLAVDHPSDTRALFDADGVAHTISSPRPAIACRAPDGSDVLSLTAAADSLSYTSNAARADQVMDSLVFIFNRQPGAHKARLLIRAKNSFWLDYVYGRFLDLFGKKIDKWHASRRKLSREQILAWTREQGIPLGVYVDDGKGWRAARYCDEVGPMALRDIIVPVTFTGNAGDPLRVKLEFGAMFWEIDQAAIDYSEEQPVAISAARAVSALDKNGIDVLARISRDDRRYYDQPSIGDRATVTFGAPALSPGMTRTVFLHSKGYYDILRNPVGKPDLACLRQFKKPGELVRFGGSRLEEMSKGRQ
jgi:hypothetical protein